MSDAVPPDPARAAASRDAASHVGASSAVASRDGAPAWAYAAAGALLVLTWALVAPAPFLSEDWTWMARLAVLPSLAGALDPALEPFRPLQHAWLWTLAHAGLDPAGWLPAAARVPALLLLLAALPAVVLLARDAGLGARGATLALLLAAAFPAAKIVAWPAAIGSPGRVACALWALALLSRRARGGSATCGALGLALAGAALLFHESAILVPALLVAWVACVPPGGACVGAAGREASGAVRSASGGAAQGTTRGATDAARRALERVLAALRDPFVLAACTLALLHAAHLAFLRPERVHVVKDLAALPANAAKAALSLAPEFVRDIGIEGLRGAHGALGFAAGGALLAAVAAVGIVALRRGGVARFAAVAIALELGLAVLGAGFVQRYACLAAAFAALGVASWARTRARVVVAGLLGLAWAVDGLADAREIRAAGRASIDLARDVRAIPGSHALVLAGLPDMAGSEEDVPWFNWGAAQFLAAHGVARPVRLVRTREFRTRSDQERLTPDELAALAAGGAHVWVWRGTGAPAPLGGR